MVTRFDLDPTIPLPTDPNNEIAKNTSIVTSSAQNDAGMFEFNLRDERYLPFEGAGAVSKWAIDLPATARLFDYDTISDVIIHISYVAKEGGNKTAVEANITTSLTQIASTVGLYRMLSLRHEFPSTFHRLLNPIGATQTAEFDLTEQHFPYFLAGKSLLISEVSVYLQPKGEDPVDTSGLILKVNSDEIRGGWSRLRLNATNLMEGRIQSSGDPIKTWVIDAGVDGLKKDELSNILILVKYTIS